MPGASIEAIMFHQRQEDSVRAFEEAASGRIPPARSPGQVNHRRIGDLVFRLFGSAWFLFLAVLVARDWHYHSFGDLAFSAFSGWSRLVSQGALVLVYLTLWLMILIRPPPIARANGLMPNVMAFAGTYLPWLIGLMPRGEGSDAGVLIASALILTGNVLIFFTICHLGKSFSLVPQARRLVTAGPYAVVRHPLYLAEEIMIAGAALLYLSPMTIVVVCLHAALQIRRIFYEEQVLSQAFPAYAAYKSRTWRLIPCVW